MAAKANHGTAVLCGFSALHVFKTTVMPPTRMEIRRPKQSQLEPCASSSKISPGGYFLCCAISKDAKLIVAADTLDKIYAFKLEGSVYKFVNYVKSSKRVIKIKFSGLKNAFFYTTKNGEVHQVHLSQNGGFESQRKLMGHLTPVNDLMCVDNYIFSADRDGRIRKSEYPNTFNIERFMVGHDESVISVQPIHLGTWMPTILSISASGELRYWNLDEGMCQVSSLKHDPYMKDHLPPNFQVSGLDMKFCSPRNKVYLRETIASYIGAVTIHGSNEVFVFELNSTDFPRPTYIGSAITECPVTDAFWSKPSLTLYTYTPNGTKICERFNLVDNDGNLDVFKDETFELPLPPSNEDFKSFAENSVVYIPPKLKTCTEMAEYVFNQPF